ncbi:MAG: PleD family two-component system response regulator [Drouetiella hepatica Uher 2000/2452]|jgi:diguanylate cyclase (GGDEF)-like protein|uniref:PleD family two-component system response regulator n=1 Tax=Drouetiella hepatica Uher 2000/2452 TaxID=904376 RepID=A0A951QCW1_9CYAN|nr:PleD family two-component system response regulator [Drouetiella hepatica Uher 2000/2452]
MTCEGNILIVDDTPDNLRFLSGILVQQGYEARTVINGRMALMAAETLPPELILLDICMPDLDGYEVCCQLKSNLKTCDIPVIFLSALDDISDKIRAFEVGGVDYITKPFHTAEVLARVKTHLTLHQLQQQLAQANQELKRLVNLDGLTQLANRRCFNEHLEQEWRRMAREQQPLALILCDIDFFKQYNDTYGHPTGDDCLQRVGVVLEACAKRPADLASRYGGEEFALTLPKTPLEGAIELAQRIQAQLLQIQIPHATSSVSSYLTLSMGIATIVPQLDRSPDDLIAAADQALYRAKQAGRDRFAIAHSWIDP